MRSDLRRLFASVLAEGGGDTLAPTCVITCTQTGPTATNPLNCTFTFSETVIGFVVSDITVGNGTAGNFAGSGAIYTADITPSAFGNVTVDVGAGVCTDNAGNENIAATQFVIFYGVFNPNGLSDGALPAPWTGGATYAIATNKVTNIPILGSELWDANASTFDGSSTYGWTAYGTNTVVNSGNTLVVTHVDNTNGAYENLNNAADLSSDLTLGTWYRLSASLKVNTGSVQPLLSAGGGTVNNVVFPAITNTTPATYNIDFRAGNATTGQIQIGGGTLGAGEAITVDNLSLKPFTFAHLLAAADAGASNVAVKAAWTVTAGRFGGVAACLNSATAPTYGYFAWTNGVQAYLAKLVNGTWTNLIRTSITYSAGAPVEIRRNGNTVQLYYNNAQVGTDQTVTDVGTGTLVGYFGTSGEVATFTVARFP